MGTLKAKMNLLAEKRQLLKGLEDELRRLRQKGSDLAASVSEITTALKKTKSERDAALLCFTNDEINEDQLAALKDKTPELESKKANFLSASEVVGEKIETLIDDKKRLGLDITSIKNDIFYLIRDDEIDKAVGYIQRAYVAHCRSFGAGIDFSDFLKLDHIRMKFSLSNDRFAKIAEEIEHAYV